MCTATRRDTAVGNRLDNTAIQVRLRCPLQRIHRRSGKSLIMATITKLPATEWAFRARFRRAAFGWAGSKLAISRIDEALSEIRTVARHDQAAAAEGAVLLLEKISPALGRGVERDGRLDDEAMQHLAHGALAALEATLSEEPR